MSAHRMATNGVCQRCGFAEGRDPIGECAPRVVYVPSTNTVQDFIAPNGVSFYSHRTLAEFQTEHADAVIMDADAAYVLHESHFRTGVTETTEERFTYALECLPPCKWGHYKGGEAFHVSERITGNIVSWYFKAAGRFFTLDDDATLHPSELLARVATHMAYHPQA